MENEDLANSCDICKMIGPKPPAIPGNLWVISWALTDTPNKVVEKSFEEVTLDKMEGLTQKEQTNGEKINQEAKVITEPEYLEELEKLEDEKKNKAPPVAAKSKKKKQHSKQINNEKETKRRRSFHHLQKNVK